MNARVDPTFGYGQADDGSDLPAPDPIVELIEKVMREHLPVELEDGVLCLEHPPSGKIMYHGPVYHRWHVAELIRDALAELGGVPAAAPEPHQHGADYPDSWRETP